MNWSETMGFRARTRLGIALSLALAAAAHAEYGPRNGGWHGGGGGGWGYPGYNGNNGDGDSDGDSDGDGFPGNSNGNGFGGNGQFGAAGFDINKASYYRNIHGIIASVVFVVLFPLGSIFMRILPGRLALWVHGIFQMLTLMVYIAAVGLGIYLARMVQIPFGGGNLLTNETTRYHPIIGLVILVVLILQPFFGYIHHKKYKRLLRRQFWSYLHIFNGRIAITVGIINGGLGLNLANASAYHKRVYIIVAAVMWGLWMVVAIISEIIRARRTRRSRIERVRPRRFVKPAGSRSPDARRSES